MANPENITAYKWEKGKSGNPKGRPIGSRSIRKILREVLEIDLEAENPLTREKETLDARTLMVCKLVQRATKGNLKAMDMIFDKLAKTNKRQYTYINKSAEIETK